MKRRRYFYFTENRNVVQIIDVRKPSSSHKIGLWPLLEGSSCSCCSETWWVAAWEITWGKLQTLQYIGSLPYDKS